MREPCLVVARWLLTAIPLLLMQILLLLMPILLLLLLHLPCILLAFWGIFASDGNSAASDASSAAYDADVAASFVPARHHALRETKLYPWPRCMYDQMVRHSKTALFQTPFGRISRGGRIFGWRIRGNVVIIFLLNSFMKFDADYTIQC